MPDDVNPSDATNQQDAGAAQTTEDTTAPVSSPGTSPEQSTENWETRYNGAMRVLRERDKAIQDLQAKFDEASASIGELNRQLESLQGNSAAKEQSLGEQLTALTTERDEAQKQLTVAQADLLKFNALKDYPDLLPLADAIPALPDQEAMKEYLHMMAKGVTDIATQKAQQLTAGMTPGPTAPNNQPQYAYASLDDWQIALNKAAGEPEFPEVSAAFRQWMHKQPQ